MVGKFPPGDWKFYWERFFFHWWRGIEEWFWWFEPFSKLKIALCEYWTSIKIKISMTCVSKEYETQTKMVHEQWIQLNMKFLLGYNCYLVEGELTFGRRTKNFVGGFFQVGGWADFWLVGALLHSPSRKNPGFC